MRPGSSSMSVVRRPHILGTTVAALVWLAAVLAPTSAHAQPRHHGRTHGHARAEAGKDGSPPPDGDKGDKGKKGKRKVFDFGGLDISGQNRSPQLLYFLERASDELERASLERRSFIPEMVRSIEEDDL